MSYMFFNELVHGWWYVYERALLQRWMYVLCCVSCLFFSYLLYNLIAVSVLFKKFSIALLTFCLAQLSAVRCVLFWWYQMFLRLKQSIWRPRLMIPASFKALRGHQYTWNYYMEYIWNKGLIIIVFHWLLRSAVILY